MRGLLMERFLQDCVFCTLHDSFIPFPTESTNNLRRYPYIPHVVAYSSVPRLYSQDVIGFFGEV